MTSLPVTAAAAGLALAASPLLASWSVALAGDMQHTWWRPRRTTKRRWAAVAAVAVVLTVAGTGGRPLLAWWLLTAGGAVLVVVDAEHNLLPARFSYPLQAAVLLALLIAAIVHTSPGALLRAIVAMVTVGGVWFLAAFASPSGVHLGDVRVAALTATTLGWLGWHHVLLGQALAVALALVTAAGVAIARPHQRGRRMPVPMGPALIAAAVLACWL